MLWSIFSTHNAPLVTHNWCTFNSNKQANGYYVVQGLIQANKTKTEVSIRKLYVFITQHVMYYSQHHALKIVARKTSHAQSETWTYLWGNFATRIVSQTNSDGAVHLIWGCGRSLIALSIWTHFHILVDDFCIYRHTQKHWLAIPTSLFQWYWYNCLNKSNLMFLNVSPLLHYSNLKHANNADVSFVSLQLSKCISYTFICLFPASDAFIRLRDSNHTTAEELLSCSERRSVSYPHKRKKIEVIIFHSHLFTRCPIPPIKP